MRVSNTTKTRGFTLVELLIVVIILAILAAIIVPQFASSTKDASDSALRSNLAAMRSAIDLYRQQHNGKFPGAVTAIPAAGCTTAGAVAGAGDAATNPNRATAFEEQLTLYTNASGGACSSSESGAFPYGPYLRADALPVNPVTDPAISTLTATDAGNLVITADGPAGGWKFDVNSGRFIANTNLQDGNSVSYETY